MLIQEKIGNLKVFDTSGRAIDWLDLEWYEADKRMLRKRTRSGRELVLKFLRVAPAFTQGDILYASESSLIAVDILPCETVVVSPASARELAAVCYEIGNKHLPLFWENGDVLTPCEAPLLRWLIAAGYEARAEKRKLLYPLKTTVAVHAHPGGGGSLFSRIMQITNPNT
ncbi:MAG TPA: urease accessory protein UreE [Puia sp.]|nr:urease accessory protein UreE [Puia sp.]